MQSIFFSPVCKWGHLGSDKRSEPLLYLSSNCNHSPEPLWRLPGPPRETAPLRPSLRHTFTKRGRWEIALLLWASLVKYKKSQTGPLTSSFPSNIPLWVPSVPPHLPPTPHPRTGAGGFLWGHLPSWRLYIRRPQAFGGAPASQGSGWLGRSLEGGGAAPAALTLGHCLASGEAGQPHPALFPALFPGSTVSSVLCVSLGSWSLPATLLGDVNHLDWRKTWLAAGSLLTVWWKMMFLGLILYQPLDFQLSQACLSASEQGGADM